MLSDVLTRTELTLRATFGAGSNRDACLKRIETSWDKARAAGQRTPMSFAENHFLYGYALPALDQALKASGENRPVIRCEYAQHTSYAVGNCCRSEAAPVPKSGISDPAKFVQSLRKTNGEPPNRAFPDFAVAAPFPGRLVGDAKVFKGGDPERALLEGIQEILHYLSLRPANSISAANGWPFDFGCLFIADLTADLQAADLWRELCSHRDWWREAGIRIIVA